MPTEYEGETYYNTTEACKHLSISRDTLNNYVNAGKIVRHKRGIGRTSYYKLTDLNKMLEIKEEDKG